MRLPRKISIVQVGRKLVVIKKNCFSGRIPGIIRRCLENNPTATNAEVLVACELTCSRQYLNKYLNKQGLERTKAKRNILLTPISKEKLFAKKICN